jgi:hypothetical protein
MLLNCCVTASQPPWPRHRFLLGRWILDWRLWIFLVFDRWALTTSNDIQTPLVCLPFYGPTLRCLPLVGGFLAVFFIQFLPSSDPPSLAPSTLLYFTVAFWGRVPRARVVVGSVPFPSPSFACSIPFFLSDCFLASRTILSALVALLDLVLSRYAFSLWGSCSSSACIDPALIPSFSSLASKISHFFAV